ncbi:LysR substrate-binding domain-containing protein [Pseudomonas sp. SDO528_S397]
MDMPDFQQLQLFLQVARAKSFTQAADASSLSVSTVSQRVGALEKQLGVRLLNRTTRSVSVTEAGEELIQKITPLLEELHTSLQSAAAATRDASGTLRLNVPSTASRMVLQPMLQGFLRKHPGINLEVAVDNSLVDIVAQGFDAGIRYDHVLAEDMVVLPVATQLRFVVVATPGYLKEHGVPTHPNDLLAHECVNYRSAQTGLLHRWDFEKAGKHLRVTVKGRLATNDIELMLRGALDGFGFAYAARSSVEQYLHSGELVQVLDDWIAHSALYLYYFNRENTPKKLRVFIDYLKHEFRG